MCGCVQYVLSEWCLGGGFLAATYRAPAPPQYFEPKIDLADCLFRALEITTTDGADNRLAPSAPAFHCERQCIARSGRKLVAQCRHNVARRSFGLGHRRQGSRGPGKVRRGAASYSPGW